MTRRRPTRRRGGKTKAGKGKNTAEATSESTGVAAAAAVAAATATPSKAASSSSAEATATGSHSASPAAALHVQGEVADGRDASEGHASTARPASSRAAAPSAGHSTATSSSSSSSASSTARATSQSRRRGARGGSGGEGGDDGGSRSRGGSGGSSGEGGVGVDDSLQSAMSILANERAAQLSGTAGTEPMDKERLMPEGNAWLAHIAGTDVPAAKDGDGSNTPGKRGSGSLRVGGSISSANDRSMMRKMRKNIRERQRRQELNHLFDRLGGLLSLRGRPEKFQVLRCAVDAINRLATDLVSAHQQITRLQQSRMALLSHIHAADKTMTPAADVGLALRHPDRADWLRVIDAVTPEIATAHSQTLPELGALPVAPRQSQAAMASSSAATRPVLDFQARGDLGQLIMEVCQERHVPLPSSSFVTPSSSPAPMAAAVMGTPSMSPVPFAQPIGDGRFVSAPSPSTAHAALSLTALDHEVRLPSGHPRLPRDPSSERDQTVKSAKIKPAQQRSSAMVPRLAKPPIKKRGKAAGKPKGAKAAKAAKAAKGGKRQRPAAVRTDTLQVRASPAMSPMSRLTAAVTVASPLRMSQQASWDFLPPGAIGFSAATSTSTSSSLRPGKTSAPKGSAIFLHSVPQSSSAPSASSVFTFPAAPGQGQQAAQPPQQAAPAPRSVFSQTKHDIAQHALPARLWSAYNDGLLCLMLEIGQRVGLFDGIAAIGSRPFRASELATRCNVNARLVMEWLSCLTCARLLRFDPQPEGGADASPSAVPPSESEPLLTRARKKQRTKDTNGNAEMTDAAQPSAPAASAAAAAASSSSSATDAIEALNAEAARNERGQFTAAPPLLQHLQSGTWCMVWSGVISALAANMDAVEQAFRHGHSYLDVHSQERFFNILHRSRLGNPEFPASLMLWIQYAGPQYQRLVAGEAVQVLEIGCGYGYALNVLARRFPKAHFVGYDLFPRAVAEAQRQATAWKLTNIEFRVGNVTHVVIPRNSVDLILAMDVLHTLPHPERVLAKVNDALVGGGTLLVSDVDGSSRLEDNVNDPTCAMWYSISTLQCVGLSLAEDGKGYGTMWGRELTHRLLREAGFADVSYLPSGGDATYVCLKQS